MKGHEDSAEGEGLACITLWQPWAQFVALGWKRIETRTHDRFAGLVGRRIAIHAAKRWEEAAVVGARPWLSSEQLRVIDGMRADYPELSGKVLCTAFVESSRRLVEADGEGALIECGTRRFGLFLRDVMVVPEPVLARGRQGIGGLAGRCCLGGRLKWGSLGTTSPYRWHGALLSWGEFAVVRGRACRSRRSVTFRRSSGARVAGCER